MTIGAAGGILAVANVLPDSAWRCTGMPAAGRHAEALALQRDDHAAGATGVEHPRHRGPESRAGSARLSRRPDAPAASCRVSGRARDDIASALAAFTLGNHMLPTTERLLLGPGPSPVSSRVMAALGAPARSHLDPEMMAFLDAVRAQIARAFRAPDGALALAVSGTGTSAMEAAVANLAEPGRRALAIVTGYFGDRLAQMLTRYGASVGRAAGRMGARGRSGRGRARARASVVRSRHCRARRNVHGRAESRSTRSPAWRTRAARS